MKQKDTGYIISNHFSGGISDLDSVEIFIPFEKWLEFVRDYKNSTNSGVMSLKEYVLYRHGAPHPGKWFDSLYGEDTYENYRKFMEKVDRRMLFGDPIEDRKQ